ncbi:ribosomal protein S5 [Patescibacteria group bacterium]
MIQRRTKKDISDLDHRLIDLRRVARVVAGGRRFKFRAAVITGDRNGKVGLGIAKGQSTPLAIQKAFRKAKKSLIQVSITKDKSIPHEVEIKVGSSCVIIKPGRRGRGLVAGGASRTVLEFAGIENATAKTISRSSNKINNARAVLEALKKLKVKKTAKKSVPEREKKNAVTQSSNKK